MNQADCNRASALGRSMVFAFALLLLGGFGAASQASEPIESFSFSGHRITGRGHPGHRRRAFLSELGRQKAADATFNTPEECSETHERSRCVRPRTSLSSSASLRRRPD